METQFIDSESRMKLSLIMVCSSLVSTSKIVALSREFNSIFLLQCIPRRTDRQSLNKTIMNQLRKRLGSHKSQWVKKVHAILWSYRATSRSSTGETSFSLTYGSEVCNLSRFVNFKSASTPYTRSTKLTGAITQPRFA